MTETLSTTSAAELDALSDSSSDSDSENATSKPEKKFVRIPRQLILGMHNFKFRKCKSGTSHETCLALCLVLAKLTPLRYTDKNPKVQSIHLRDLRREWKVYGFNTTVLRELVEMLTELDNKSPLAGWMLADDTHISVLYQWVSHVVVPTDYVPQGFDLSKVRLPKTKPPTNYIRVPIALIPLLRTHAAAVDAVLYAVARNIRPHAGLAAHHRYHHVSKEQLQKMIDEVWSVYEREKQADALRRQNAKGDKGNKGASVKQAAQPARQDQPAQPAVPSAAQTVQIAPSVQPAQQAQPAPSVLPAQSADIIAPPSDAQHGGTTGV